MKNDPTQPQPPKHPLVDAYIRVADSLSIAFGRLMAVFVVLLVLLIVHEVVRRYFFSSPTIWGLELQLFAYGTICMLSIPYATYKKAHPRVPVLLDKCSPRVRYYLEILYILVFFMPFVGVLVWWDAQVAYRSWFIQERSVLTAWMPLLWPIKATIPLGAALVMVQGFAELMKIIKNGGGAAHEL